MSKNWQAGRRQDHYYHRAKAENYRSRAAFKLLQMSERYSIFKEGDVVIDLGANPGGWCQAAKQLVGDDGMVIGIDLKPIEPLKGVHLIRGDARSDRVRKEINTILFGEDHIVDEGDFDSRIVLVLGPTVLTQPFVMAWTIHCTKRFIFKFVKFFKIILK